MVLRRSVSPPKNKRMSSADSKHRPKFWPKLLKWLAANTLGVFVAALVFLALPFMQIVGQMGKKELEVRTVATTQPPPPPPVIEEPPPEEPPPPEQQPQMDDLPQEMSLSDLGNLIDPGGGGSGAKILSDALSSAVQNRASDAFAASQLDQQPRPVYQAAPKYPNSLRRQGISGEVKIEIVVDARGRVVNPRIVESSNRAFEDPALDAVQQWKFEPGKRGGTAVPFKMLVPIRFQAG